MSKTKAHIRYKDSQGNHAPGVSTIVGILGLNKQALIKWANNMGLKGIDSSKYRDEKADAGILGHKFIMNYLKKLETDTIEYSKKIIDMAENSFMSFLEWEKGHKLEPILIEEPLVFERQPTYYEYSFGGTPDFYGDVNGIRELIDFKTGSGIYDESIIQVSAYKFLIQKVKHYPVTNTRIIRIPRSEDERFEDRLVSKKELEICYAIFENCIEIYRLRKEWKTK